VLFTGANKLTLATQGKQAFEDRKVRNPAGDEDLRADFHKLKKEQGSTGQPRFVADSDAAGHADRTWARFLAIHAAKGSAYAIDWTPLPALAPGWEGGVLESRDFMRPPRDDDRPVSGQGAW
jgi:phage FluMu gp28-like protein